jgi:competence ComEA-like helix-hairpin-helix protein
MEQNLEERARKDPSSKLFAPLADTYRKKGDTYEAIGILTEGLAHHPGYISARVLLAKCYEDLGNWDKAGDEWLNVIKLDSRNLVALKGMGQICHWLRKPEESGKWFRLYLEEFPDDEVIRRNLARIEADLRKKEDLEKVETPPVDVQEVEIEDHPVVESVEEEALESLEPVQDKSVQHVSAGEYPAAEPDVVEEDVFEEEPVETMTLAEIYAQQGFFERAIDIYKRILVNDPDSTKVRERIDELERRLAGSGETTTMEEGDSPASVIKQVETEREGVGEFIEESREEEIEDQSLRIDVNMASALDLEIIPGVGPVIAQKIIVERERNGPFTDHHELERVPGLGKKTIERISPHLIFEIAVEEENALITEISDLIGVEDEIVVQESEVGIDAEVGFEEEVETEDEEDGEEGVSEFEEFKRWLKNLRK